MAPSPPSPPSLDQFPRELVQAVAHEAALDAHRVALFLEELGLVASLERPLIFDADALLALGSSLRLLVWEDNGILIHRHHGLPPAMDLVKEYTRRLLRNEGNTDGRDLSVKVVGWFVQHFAWHGRKELDALLVLDDPDEDVVIEALADFLRQNRNKLEPRPHEGE